MSRGWIFDLDGTLVDSLPGIAASLNAALATQGLPTHSASSVRTFIGDGAEMLVRRALTGLEDPPLDSVLQAFREHYADHWHEGTIPYEGIRELLKSLRARGDILAVLSNKPHSFTTEIVDELFPQTFLLVMGQRPGIPHKPDPAGLWDILRAPEWTATGTVLIGDSVMDIQTAQAAGIDAIAVTWGYHDRAALLLAEPAKIIEHVSELADLLSLPVPLENR